ncbi:hypothetical protein [Desulforamulus ferrireducens]|uniref:Uncharacterized protein n=1 Tax=Desulforamulus ferrireducens TaxID=1833852 RepID=A0A1S6ITU1_9FIRM|nr:hypothetical protein [Desulforamulus ferrireducens]AQS58188.1 hypothetical protein B0537_03210 [Desulforamulus ferrireducens]
MRDLSELLVQSFAENWRRILLGTIEQQVLNDCLLVVNNLSFAQQGVLLSMLQGHRYNIIIS